MLKKTVDLSSYLNQTIQRGHPADFPASLCPLSYCAPDGSFKALPNRLAVVRNDTKQALSVVSDRYTFVPHQRLLDTMQEAVRSLDVGPVPRGIYVDRQGARMRAIFKFPALRQDLAQGDEMCPCVQIANTYDGTARIKVSIGAFRFVCTNLAVGGGGVFAGGFMAVHAGQIPVEEVGEQLVLYLSRFDGIVRVYRAWVEIPVEEDKLHKAFEGVSQYHLRRIHDALPIPASVYEAYNTATTYATHETRSAAVAFALLEFINRGFQKNFPVP
ncbi:DUF945 domain-containing protein [Acidobacteria bacterium AH-259-A15]|nr:DUF945 domain-containing protein [Acidobacteria bacterium AH-259-A15]